MTFPASIQSLVTIGPLAKRRSMAFRWRADSSPLSYVYCVILFCEFCVDVLGTPFDLCVTCQVIIGSVPLRSIVQQNLPDYETQPITDQPAASRGPLLSNKR